MLMFSSRLLQIPLFYLSCLKVLKTYGEKGYKVEENTAGIGEKTSGFEHLTWGLLTNKKTNKYEWV